jgi:hypothetical protein
MDSLPRVVPGGEATIWHICGANPRSKRAPCTCREAAWKPTRGPRRTRAA